MKSTSMSSVMADVLILKMCYRMELSTVWNPDCVVEREVGSLLLFSAVQELQLLNKSKMILCFMLSLQVT